MGHPGRVARDVEPFPDRGPARSRTESLEAARAANDTVAEAVSLISLAIDHLELGRVDEWTRLATQADRIARRERLPFLLYTYSWVELGLAAMRGDDAEAERLTAVTLDWAAQVSLTAEDLAKPVIALMRDVWRLGPGVDVTFFRLMARHPLGTTTAHALLGRAGRPDLVAEELRDHPYAPVRENWQTLVAETLEAEAASHVGDVALARRAVAALTPWSGRMNARRNPRSSSGRSTTTSPSRSSRRATTTPGCSARGVPWPTPSDGASRHTRAGRREPSTGRCTSDAAGVITIPNLGPNRYGATVSPPAGQSGWVQTTTLEGGHDHDIWVQEGDTGLDTEFIKGAEPVPATQFGFVRVKALPISTATGEVKGVAVAGLPYIGGQNGQVVPETGWAGAKSAGPDPLAVGRPV